MKNDETGPETPVVDPIRDGGTDRPPGGDTPGEAGASATLAERLQTTGAELVRSLRGVLSALPTGPHRPNQLARELGVNRAVASRLLSAIGKRDPLEALHVVPGPEPLRRVVRSALEQGVDHELLADAEAAVRAFDLLIRDDAGTRAALDALIASSLPGARERFELASKYSVHKGMSQLKGVQAECWLGTAVVWPSAENPGRHDLTWLNGAVAMQRLRPGVTVRFSYRHRRDGETPDTDETAPPLSVLSLDDYCLNPPARLQSTRAGNTVHYTLPDDLLGPREVVDMFVVDHHPAAMRRYAKDTPRHRNSLFVEPAMPVGTLVFDVFLHDEVFPGSEPQLITYDTGYDGIANVNDADRDIDRVELAEVIEYLGHDLRQVRCAEIPTYKAMLLHLGERFGWEPECFRGYRTRIRYPVYGWQVCLSFDPPTESAASTQGSSG